MYAEPFEPALITSIFTDTGRNTIVANASANIRTAIIGIINATSTANRAVIATIINSLILSVHFDGQQFPLRTPVTVQNSLLTAVAAG